MRGVIATLALLLAGPAMAQEAGQPPAIPQIDVYTFYTTPDVDGAGSPLLRKPALAGRPAIGADLYPANLLAEPGRRQESARVRVALDDQGRPTACVADGGEVLVDRQRSADPVEPALHALLCSQAMGSFSFHHALAADGSPVPSSVVVEGRFGWRDYLRYSPAMAPPAADVVSVDGWPMRYPPRIPPGARLPLASGSDFVPRNRDRPQRAAVGLLLTTTAGGQLSECQVVRPSGVVDYDEASCRVLAASRLPGPFTSLAVQLNWDGRQVSAQLPVEPRGPALQAQPRLDAAVADQVDKAGPYLVRVQLAVSPEGSLTRCTVTSPSYVDALDVAACATFGPETQFVAARGNFGEPVAGILRMAINWRDLTLRPDGY